MTDGRLSPLARLDQNVTTALSSIRVQHWKASGNSHCATGAHLDLLLACGKPALLHNLSKAALSTIQKHAVHVR